MNREAQSVLLLLVGGAVLRISVSDVYLRYVKEGLRPFLIVAGALLVVIAVATLVRELFGSEAAEEEIAAEQHLEGAPAGAHAGHDDGHGHSHHGPRVAWLLVLPVFATFLIAPPALGSYAASRGGTAAVDKPTAEFAPLPRTNPAEISVVEYFTRAVWDKGETMKGRDIKLTGFITPRADGGVYLTRIMLSCCAADGRPVKVGLSGDAATGLKPDVWVEVVGRYDPETEKDKANDQSIPYLEVGSVKQVPAPKRPYE
jgi:uncharacterized repeat protein (TIGR03943 family)